MFHKLVKLAQKNNLTEDQFGSLVALCIEMLDDPDYITDSDDESSSEEEGEDDLVIESITISRTEDGFYKIN